ncbi:hypothetical protein [Nonomuraea sp. NPDC003709]|uniref:hypothetical protein n=1 Tax=Nonomuraea sp. NPDC003709 TaxID=3154450 RepID=UPI00339F2914
MLIVAVLTLLTAQLGRPSYLSPTNAVNVLDQSSLIAILAVFTTVVLISGNFDLSVASVAAFSAATVLSLVAPLGLPATTAIALGSGFVGVLFAAKLPAINPTGSRRPSSVAPRCSAAWAAC